MGSGPGDKTSVVDSNLRFELQIVKKTEFFKSKNLLLNRVVGTTGLRVIDNSIQPKVVTTNTNLPAIVIGEKGADIVLNAWA